MGDSKTITAIDIGTTKVCTIVGRINSAGHPEVLAHSLVPCQGLKKGNVEDVDATASAVRASIQDVEKQTGTRVRSAYVGVTGAHVTFENRWDSLDWVGEQGVITAEELTRVPETVASASSEDGRGVIHALPMIYRLDGQDGIRDPSGMHSKNLEVETHVVTGGLSAIGLLVKAVEESGIKVDSLVLEPLASSEAVLTRQEKERGVVMVDIGGGTTDVVAFKDGNVAFTAVIPVGGYQFTYDICQTYDTSYEAAEAAKLAYAHTEPYVASPQEEVSLPLFDSGVQQKVSRRDLCQLTRERAQELVHLIKMKLQEADIGDITKTRVVSTGGTSNLPGLQGLMQRILTNSVRIGIPDSHRNIPPDLRAPHFATAVGILLWAREHGPSPVPATNGHSPAYRNGHGGLVSRFLRHVRNLWPVEVFLAKNGRIQWR